MRQPKDLTIIAHTPGLVLLIDPKGVDTNNPTGMQINTAKETFHVDKVERFFKHIPYSKVDGDSQKNKEIQTMLKDLYLLRHVSDEFMVSILEKWDEEVGKVDKNI